MKAKLTLMAALCAATLWPVAGQAAPTARTSVFGTAADGRQVDLITLTNDAGMVVKVSSRGGTIIELDVPDRDGKPDNVVLGYKDFAAWEKARGFNSIIGRYANRIGGGGFTLDGVFYKLPANPKTNISMHGGPNGFASQLYRATTFERADAAGVTLHYVSADGENGYPGALTLDVTYTLTADNVLRLEYRATTTKPTVVNLTNHSYFTLGGHASGPIYPQWMQVFAGRWTPTDDNQLPTGAIDPVDGTPFDFRKPARLLDRIYSDDPQMVLAKGIDHNFILDGASGAAARLAVRLYDPGSGRQMEVRTSEPAVQIYSGNNLFGTIVGADGRALRQSDGIAFETEHFPDSPNKPGFPSTVLRPGETFHSVTEFAFSTDAKPFPDFPRP